MTDQIISQQNELEEAEGVVAAYDEPPFKVLHLNGQRLVEIPENLTDEQLHGFVPPCQLLTKIIRTNNVINLVTDSIGPLGSPLIISPLEAAGANGGVEHEETLI